MIVPPLVGVRRRLQDNKTDSREHISYFYLAAIPPVRQASDHCKALNFPKGKFRDHWTAHLAPGKPTQPSHRCHPSSALAQNAISGTMVK